MSDILTNTLSQKYDVINYKLLYGNIVNIYKLYIKWNFIIKSLKY